MTEKLMTLVPKIAPKMKPAHQRGVKTDKTWISQLMLGGLMPTSTNHYV